MTPRGIAPRGGALTGAEYGWIDADPIIGRSHYYIQAIDRQGDVQRFGPVSVDVAGSRDAPTGRSSTHGVPGSGR